MTNKPTKRVGESTLAYYLRLAEWERIYKQEMAIEMKSLDRLALRAKFQHDRATTAQTQLNRRSLHEIAENNPILRNVLRKLQK